MKQANSAVCIGMDQQGQPSPWVIVDQMAGNPAGSNLYYDTEWFGALHEGLGDEALPSLIGVMALG